MFRGSAQAKIDDRGRLKVPTGFRNTMEEEFGPELFVTSILGDSALLYPLPVWEQIEDRLRSMPSTDRTRNRFLERVNYFGQQGQMDAQGRLLLPQVLRDSAELTGEVVVNAELDHLVVWNRERILERLDGQPFTEDDFATLSEFGI